MAINPDEHVIKRRRKKYKFALFTQSALCFELEQWPTTLQPTVLELGAGTATFSVALALGAPSIMHVAVDVKADRLQTGARRATERALANLYFLRARAEQLPEILQPHSLKTLWITFADPYPKKRSAKHRLTHSHYLKLYNTLLKKDGALYFKTDAEALFLWSLEQLVEAGWGINQLNFDLHSSTLPEPYKVMTTYEKQYVKNGAAIYFVKATPPKV